MAENKKYYWLKLKEDFFEEDTINWLEEQENGKEYCLFYLKLCLKSLKTDGVLIRKVGDLYIPYDVKKLSEMTNTDVDTTRVAMEVFKQIGLIEILDNGEIYLSQLQNMVGSETASTIRSRKSRANKNTMLHCNTDATFLQHRDRERDIEIEKEIDIDIEIDNVEKLDRIPYSDIITYLNGKTGYSYKDTTRKTRDLIKARFNEGFVADDFKKVIDTMCSEWLLDEKMKAYLRPETLFGTKFESYLNREMKKVTLQDVATNEDFMNKAMKGFFE